MTPGPIYLDCAATTPVDRQVLEVVLRFMGEEFGNAGSRTHDFGNRARRALEHARDQVAAVVGCGRGDVIFTGGATESNNLAILGLAEHGRDTGRRHLVATQIEHPAVLEPLAALTHQGFELTLVPPAASGVVEPAAMMNAVRPDTLLLSMMQVNNETGVRQPIHEVAELLGDRSTLMHVDASQGFGKEITSLRHPRIDLISISGHKIYAPKGVGALVTRKRNGQRPPVAPLIYGGGQERGLRPGTHAVHLIVGLGLASELALRDVVVRNRGCAALGHRLIEGLAPLRPNYNGDPARTIPQIVNLSFPGVSAEAVIESLADVVAISNGSACSSQSLTCSHVLGAMGLDAGLAEGALRWSWCHETAEPNWRVIRERVTALQAGDTSESTCSKD